MSDLSDFLSSRDLTADEKVRLERLKAAVGEIIGNPNLSDEEKNDMIARLRTAIDPLERRDP